MKARPTAVIMISSLTEQGADVTLRALELGAVDYLAKPKLDIAKGIEQYRAEIISKIHSAAKANISNSKPRTVSQPGKLQFKTTEKLIAIGASTGGTEAIKAVLTQLPIDSPGIVITQHMPPGFTTSFANRLNSLCRITVQEAKGGERIVPGYAYLAPGDKHLKVVRSEADFRIELVDGPRVSGHKPAVDVMFQSVALAQDEQSSLIFGMPQEAIKTGVVKKVMALDEVSSTLIEVLNAMEKSYRI